MDGRIIRVVKLNFRGGGGGGGRRGGFRGGRGGGGYGGGGGRYDGKRVFDMIFVVWINLR